MPDATTATMNSSDHRIVLILLVIIAAVGVSLSFLLDWRTSETNMQSVARERGAALFRLVELTRNWNAGHDGVYVAVTEATKPNPYLDHPRRDLTTHDGVALTMINPAFMTRQIAEIAESESGIRIHLTSLNPLRPDNRADAWEVAALERFEHGQAETIEFMSGTAPVHRYMAPLRVLPACMKCHAKQGYETGQIRGGISITMPAMELLALRDGDRVQSAFEHLLVFAVITALLHLLSSRTRAHVQALERVNRNQEVVIAERTRSLTEANAALEYELVQREVAATVFEHSTEGIVVMDSAGLIEQVSPAFTRITGYSQSESVGKDLTYIKSDHHPPEFVADLLQTMKLEGGWHGELWNRRRSGEIFVTWLSIASVGAEGNSRRYVATFSDITVRKEMEDHLRHLAYHDALTDLPNRALFGDRLQMSMTLSLRHARQFALLYVDLDRFKAVNDELGHGAGDRLLIEAAGRLRSCVRESDTVARLGGDEFAVILTELSSINEVEAVAARMVAELARPFHLNVGIGSVSASIGVAVYPDHGTDVITLNVAADTALYRVKEGGRNGYGMASRRVVPQGD